MISDYDIREFKKIRGKKFSDSGKKSSEELITIINSMSPTERLKCALAALRGDFYRFPVKGKLNPFQVWRKWILSDSPYANAWWFWLLKQIEGIENKFTDQEVKYLRDRDIYAFQLYKTMNAPFGRNRLARSEFEERYSDWQYYQRFLFNWFLQRYEIVYARCIYEDDFWVRWSHILWGILSMSLVTRYFLYWRLSEITVCNWLVTVVSLSAVAMIAFAPACHNQLKFRDAVQTLIPRMAITTGVGYLALFSASGLVAVLYAAQDANFVLGLALVIVAVVGIYVRSIIRRKVVPPPRGDSLLRKSFHTLWLGATYSAIGLFLFAPVLFRPPFLEEKIANNSPESQAYLVLTAAIALAIGVVLQLVWEDKPITEPL